MDEEFTKNFWDVKFNTELNKNIRFIKQVESKDGTVQYMWLNFSNSPVLGDLRGHFLGFSGAWWKLLMPNGSFSVSNNVWSAGVIPPEYNHLIPPEQIGVQLLSAYSWERKWWEELQKEHKVNHLDVSLSDMKKLFIFEQKIYDEFESEKGLPMSIPMMQPMERWEWFLDKYQVIDKCDIGSL